MYAGDERCPRCGGPVRSQGRAQGWCDACQPLAKTLPQRILAIAFDPECCQCKWVRWGDECGHAEGANHVHCANHAPR